VLETPDPQAGKGAYDTLRALGSSVAARSRIYVWPHTRRPRDAAGRQGILHVKCVAADGRRLFLSSANLTEYALDLNMELGVIVSEASVARSVEDHFDRLIDLGILTAVQPGFSAESGE
jgi:phosphatidylserine/phosphatidylglycerophosphate/cardiolipin synthase-like enzyme